MRGDGAPALCFGLPGMARPDRRRSATPAGRGSRAPGARLPLALLAMLAVPAAARAQDIEPCAYSNAPVGVNFLVGSYAFTRGGLSFDVSVSPYRQVDGLP